MMQSFAFGGRVGDLVGDLVGGRDGTAVGAEVGVPCRMYSIMNKGEE